MFILSSISSGLEFWSVHDNSMYENSELKVFAKLKFLGEVSSAWKNNLLETNVHKTFKSCWQSLLGIL